MRVLEAKIIYYSDEIEKYKKIIENFFYDMGVKGLKIEEPNFKHNPLDFYRDENAYISQEYSVSAYFPLNFYTNKRKEYIREKIDSLFLNDENIVFKLDFYEYEEEDYQNSWKKYLFVEHIGERFVIKPSWREYEKKENEIMIELDPGRAFGTGSHPTTALCLNFLEKLDVKNMSAIDIGTGSGILALALNKLGCKNITASDIDEVSLEVARENFKLNGIKENEINLLKGNLLEVATDKNYDLVIANILYDVLIKLLDDIDKIIKKDSKILFSGIIADKLEMIKAKILQKNYKIIEIKEEKEWRAILFTKDEE